MDVVGVALAGVALLDPAYHGLQSLWKAHRVTKNFGEDFEHSMSSLRSQEWCNDLARKFENECKVANCAAIATEETSGSPEAKVCTSRPTSTFLKFPQRSKIETALQSYFPKRPETKISQKIQETTNTPPLNTRRPDPISEEGPSFSPTLEKGTLAYHKKRVDKRIEEAQKKVTVTQLLRWTGHGKQDFDGFILRLRAMNDDLRKLLPIIERLEDAFRKIRPSPDRPVLWQKTEKIRHELDGLHLALRSVNFAIPDEGISPIKLAVKVEEDFDELRSRAEDDGIISGLPLTRHPILISLIPTLGGLDGADNNFILSTTVLKATENEIFNLPERITTLRNLEPHFNVIGNVIHSLENRWIYHLQRVEDMDLIGGHLVSTLVEDIRLRAKERICLAADIARSYIHFMTINMGRSRGLLSSYRLFGQETPAATTGNWSNELLSSLWVDFGFGTSTTGKAKVFRSKAQYREEKISAAVELGILLYQISAGKALEYDTTAESLQRARQKAREGLPNVEQFCGEYMREIVEICLMEAGNNFEDKDIVEEVASALSYHATRLKKAGPKA
ncbi:hypothetical protein FALBO_2098 [Fusarium albosuccineum]|uniref:Prion-inhibition and propagation HeLo domain-containing protein n=1 Tax=Fusarium albosuccineum TaxID=1237068 RepID=A0A8H4PLP8_9HYPO|nr:hypothetical protein FALBO_2098 [Fusarium albosuccineum]